MWCQWEVNQDGHMGALLPLSSMSPKFYYYYYSNQVNVADVRFSEKIPLHQGYQLAINALIKN